MKLKQRAVMFGLDARVALAIFGALSLITGEALYKTIKEAKIVSMIATIKEVEKAYESYYLDTGSYTSSGGTDVVDIEDLIIEPAGVQGWKGPYLLYKESLIRNGLVTEYDDIILRARSS